MLFTRYRCRSHIQDKRTVHLLNCMLSLKSQMTYWAKVLLIAACPSAQHPKLLLPPAEKTDNRFEAHRKPVESTVLSHQKSSVYTDLELAGLRKIHLPETHFHRSILPGPICPCKETGVMPRKALEMPNAAHITPAQQEEGCCPEVEHGNKHQSPWPLRSAFCGAPSEKDGMARFT